MWTDLWRHIYDIYIVHWFCRYVCLAYSTKNRIKCRVINMKTQLTNSELWIKYLNPNTNGRLRLFCFPYAGGDIKMFFKWPKVLPVAVETCAVQLPGRGRRLREKPYWELSSLVKALADVMFPHLTKPFALFGHSMGALISFELARHLRKHYASSPAHLFLSGYRAPQIHSFIKPTDTLSDKQLLRRLRWLKIIPKRILEDTELLELILPTLRADFSLCTTYQYSHAAPLNCPITTFAGSRDCVTRGKKVKAWREQTNSHYRHYTIPGNHFFLHSSESLLLRILSQELDPYISGVLA